MSKIAPALEPHALFRVGGEKNYRCNVRRLFWEKCVFLECGHDLGWHSGGGSGQILENAAQTSKYHDFLMRWRAVFLWNHSISWEMAVPDAIWLQKPWISLRFLSPQPKGGHSFPEDIYQKSLVSLVFCDDSPPPIWFYPK